MRSAFEIVSFPDLSLPRYFDLFGEEALAVAATRLFTWLQIVTSTRQEMSFTLRYSYDPSREPSNRRLRIFVVMSGPDDVPTDPIVLGRRLCAEVLQIIDTDPESVLPAKENTASIALLERKETLSLDRAETLYAPAFWTRQATARNALEPYIDEAFAALMVPAFLDIQLHVSDPSGIRQVLRSISEQLERRKHGTSVNDGSHLLNLQAFGDALAGDPVCHLLICAGSRDEHAADGLLRAFGVDAIGGSRFRIAAVTEKDPRYLAVMAAVETGRYGFQDDEGWFSRSLRNRVETAALRLSDPQIATLKQLSELSVLAGPDLIRDVVTLPIPRRGYLRTFPLETERDRSVAPISIRHKLSFLGLGMSLERQEPIELPIADLPRHAFVAGVTGSGKTVTMFNILRQLADQSIPFIVFEPAKAEYRGLAGYSGLHEKLRVYTPGRDELSPLRMNPFAFDPHITLASHIAGLAAAFSCAMGLFPPINAILEEALWKLYETKGWREDDRGSARPQLPRVDEIPEVVCKIIDSLGYDAEVSGRFKGVIRSRFIRLSRGSVGRLFDCDSSMPSIQDICKTQSVVELNTLTQQEANLVTLFFLVAIREHLSDSRGNSGQLRQVLVLEEAHNLVPSVPDENSGSEESSAKVEGSRYVSNMLAEMRALGLGIMVVDQTPAAVATQVIRNTNLKIAHRTVAKQDRETLSDAMLMHPAHAELLGRLVPGQAYVYADRFYRPQLMQGVIVSPDKSIRKAGGVADVGSPSDQDLATWLQKCDWYRDAFTIRNSELKKRVENTREALEQLVEEIRGGLACLTEISDSSQWEQLRRDLHATLDGRCAYFAGRLRSLGTEQRAVASIARGMRLKTVPSERVDAIQATLGLVEKSIQLVSKIEPGVAGRRDDGS